MASTRVFLVLQLVALANSANWSDDSELVEEERALEDQESKTWLDEMELDNDDSDKDRKNKKASVGDPRLTCENLWEDKYCKRMTWMCKKDDDDDEYTSSNKRQVRTHCRKSCNLCKWKKLPDRYVERILKRKDVLSNTCEDTKETSLCQKLKDKCTTGGIKLLIILQNKCRKTCGYCE